MSKQISKKPQRYDPIEKLFEQYIPEWIFQFRRYYYNGTYLKFEKDLTNFLYCPIGDLRKLAGLPRDARFNAKKKLEDQPHVCGNCVDIIEELANLYYNDDYEYRHLRPNRYYDDVNEEFREDYLAILRRIKYHFEECHKVML